MRCYNTPLYSLSPTPTSSTSSPLLPENVELLLSLEFENGFYDNSIYHHKIEESIGIQQIINNSIVGKYSFLPLTGTIATLKNKIILNVDDGFTVSLYVKFNEYVFDHFLVYQKNSFYIKLKYDTRLHCEYGIGNEHFIEDIQFSPILHLELSTKKDNIVLFVNGNKLNVNKIPTSILESDRVIIGSNEFSCNTLQKNNLLILDDIKIYKGVLHDDTFPPPPINSLTPTPTPTVTPTLSATIAQTVTPTSSFTPTITPTNTISLSLSASVSLSPTITISPSIDVSITPTITPTSSLSNTPSISESISVSQTPSITPTIGVSITPTQTISYSESVPIPSITVTATPTVEISNTPTISVTPSITESLTPTTSLSNSPTPSLTPSLSESVTPTISLSNTPTISLTLSLTESITPTTTPTISLTPTISNTVSISNSPTISLTPSLSESVTPTITPTISITPTITESLTNTPSNSESITEFRWIIDNILINVLLDCNTTTEEIFPECSITENGNVFVQYTNKNEIGLDQCIFTVSTYYCSNIILPPLSHTPTPTITSTPTFTSTVTPSLTPSVTLTESIIPTNTPSITSSNTPSITPSNSIEVFNWILNEINFNILVECDSIILDEPYPECNINTNGNIFTQYNNLRNIVLNQCFVDVSTFVCGISIYPPPTLTPSLSHSITPTISESITPTMSFSNTITPSISNSVTPTISLTPSLSESITPTISLTPTNTPSNSEIIPEFRWILDNINLNVLLDCDINENEPFPECNITENGSIFIQYNNKTEIGLNQCLYISNTYYCSDHILPPLSNTPTPSVTTTVSLTPTVTPSITPSITPSLSITESIIPSITPSTSLSNTPSITPSKSIESYNWILDNISLNIILDCDSVTLEEPYPECSINSNGNTFIQYNNKRIIGLGQCLYDLRTFICGITLYPPPSLSNTPSYSITPTSTISLTPTISNSVTPTISFSNTPTISVTPTISNSVTPTVSLSNTPTKSALTYRWISRGLTIGVTLNCNTLVNQPFPTCNSGSNGSTFTRYTNKIQILNICTFDVEIFDCRLG